MELFQPLRFYAEIIGISLKSRKHNGFNRRHLLVLFIFLFYSISSTAFLLFDAKTFKEYSEASFVWLTVISICFGFFTQILKSQELIDLIINSQTMIEFREYFTVEYYGIQIY